MKEELKELKKLEELEELKGVDFITLKNEIIAKYGDLKKFENELEQSLYDKVVPVITQTQDTIRNSNEALQERLEKNLLVKITDFEKRMALIEAAIEKLKGLIWPKWHFQATYVIIIMLITMNITLLFTLFNIVNKDGDILQIVEDGFKKIELLIESK